LIYIFTNAEIHYLKNISTKETFYWKKLFTFIVSKDCKNNTIFSYTSNNFYVLVYSYIYLIYISRETCTLCYSRKLFALFWELDRTFS